MNRIHGWLDGQSPFEWHASAASVLPLQGFWNALIFFVTSWKQVRDAVLGIKSDRDASGSDQNRDDDLAADRSTANVLGRCDTDVEDGDSATMGSDVELRRVPKQPGRSSSSTITVP